MTIRRFLDFVVASTATSVTFSESEGGAPLWVVDTALLAGLPSLSVRTRKRVRATLTTITLSGSRYPGTQLPADLTLVITEFPDTEEQSASEEVRLTLAVGDAQVAMPVD